jgi:hypothetical protein
MGKGIVTIFYLVGGWAWSEVIRRRKRRGMRPSTIIHTKIFFDSDNEEYHAVNDFKQAIIALFPTYAHSNDIIIIIIIMALDQCLKRSAFAFRSSIFPLLVVKVIVGVSAPMYSTVLPIILTQ